MQGQALAGRASIRCCVELGHAAETQVHRQVAQAGVEVLQAESGCKQTEGHAPQHRHDGWSKEAWHSYSRPARVSMRQTRSHACGGPLPGAQLAVPAARTRQTGLAGSGDVIQSMEESRNRLLVVARLHGGTAWSHCSSPRCLAQSGSKAQDTRHHLQHLASQQWPLALGVAEGSQQPDAGLLH